MPDHLVCKCLLGGQVQENMSGVHNNGHDHANYDDDGDDVAYHHNDADFNGNNLVYHHANLYANNNNHADDIANIIANNNALRRVSC